VPIVCDSPRPTLAAAPPRRALCRSFRPVRLWPSSSRRMRFSVRSYLMASCCYRLIQPAMANTVNRQTGLNIVGRIVAGRRTRASGSGSMPECEAALMAHPDCRRVSLA